MTTSTHTRATLSNWVGKELGTSKWVTVDQDRMSWKQFEQQLVGEGFRRQV